MSFKRFEAEDLVISSDVVAAPLWSTASPTLTQFYTSSQQVPAASGQFYYNVFDVDVDVTSSAAVQFAIAFAHKNGSGSLYYNSATPGKSPSVTIYGQYRNLVLGDEGNSFIFGDVTGSYFHVISVDRDRFKESLLPGTFNLTLQNGTNNVLHLTDNSADQAIQVFNEAGRVYQIISGSNGAAYLGNGYSVSGSYGIFLPDIGTLLLNSLALEQLSVSSGGTGLGLTVVKGANVNGLNNKYLFNAIVSGSSFQLNSQETVPSQYVFTRVRNGEFNYSTNPSFITGSGDVRINRMVNAPQTYITSVGMYNDNNELLAVAKLSRPLLKDFTKEALIRIKLDF